MYYVIVIFFTIIYLSNTYKTFMKPTMSYDNIQEKIMNSMCGVEVFSDKTDCYSSAPEDDIAPVERNFTARSNSIFFIDPSCGGGLNFKQACSVESAARAHPKRDIYVFFLGPVAELCLTIWPLVDLQKYQNIKFYRLNLTEFLQYTPLADFVTCGDFRRSAHPYQHTMDITKFATLYKFGGIFVGLDVIVAKPFDTLPFRGNWIVRKGKKELGSALIALNKTGIGEILSYETLRRLKVNYNPKSWHHNGIKILISILEIVCKTSDILKMKSQTCEGFHIYSPDLFYPVRYQNFELYYRKHDGHIPKEPFTFHMWSDLALGMNIYKDSLYGKLMEKFCPTIYSTLARKKAFIRP